jgi:hypothetical protein
VGLYHFLGSLIGQLGIRLTERTNSGETHRP